MSLMQSRPSALIETSTGSSTAALVTKKIAGPTRSRQSESDFEIIDDQKDVRKRESRMLDQLIRAILNSETIRIEDKSLLLKMMHKRGIRY